MNLLNFPFMSNKFQFTPFTHTHPDSIPFLVKSDTSYLNLRYGPSKKYDVIEKIPDGKTINGYGERTDGDGNIWVYVKYNDKSGWVMKELLSGTE